MFTAGSCILQNGELFDLEKPNVNALQYVFLETDGSLFIQCSSLVNSDLQICIVKIKFDLIKSCKQQIELLAQYKVCRLQNCIHSFIYLMRLKS